MAVLTTTWPRTAESPHTRQQQAVMNHLMKAAFGDPQVHHRVHASPDFRAALNALDPGMPEFIPDEGARNMIMIGCLHVIDITAALLKYARENDLRLAPPVKENNPERRS
ncbi:MAG: hypothetical protein EHM21_05845 [Chloroflexi bacterium]|nr:MAG: hypothetical protein EHM21_05845 [Chloroflexota bacterium]